MTLGAAASFNGCRRTSGNASDTRPRNLDFTLRSFANAGPPGVF